MRVIRGLQQLHQAAPACVATIGNFDGVHRGHQAIISVLQHSASESGVPATVILFEPQPAEFFQAAQAPIRLFPLREKLQVLHALGIEQVLCLRFDKHFAALAPQDFIQQVLLQGLGVKALYVGDDFRFGHQRAGDFALLQVEGKAHGFRVQQSPTVMYETQRISSSWLRQALLGGDCELAQALLGRPYTISGKVIHGDKRGREWGTPTANIPIKQPRPALEGIFVVEVEGLGERPLPAVASLGTRPMVAGEYYLLEVHLLDFDADIYGKRLRVKFLHKLRGEASFASIDALIAQIFQDIDETRKFFAQRYLGH